MVAQSVHVAPRGLWEVVLAGPAALCICLGTPASPLWEKVRQTGPCTAPATPQSHGRDERPGCGNRRTTAQETERHKGHVDGGVGARGSAPLTRDMTG